jgi:hypothetical protein
MTSQLLAGTPAASIEQVVDQLLAVQAQDPRGTRLAVRARSRRLRAADVDAALTDRRSLVIGWLNRGTLHLVRAADYWWLHRLTAPQLVTGNARRLAQEGVSAAQADRGVDVLAEQVATRGPSTRAELRAALDEAGVPTARQATVHLLFAASLRGDIVRGPMRGREQCFVDAADWLGRQPSPLDRTEALGNGARRCWQGRDRRHARELEPAACQTHSPIADPLTAWVVTGRGRIAGPGRWTASGRGRSFLDVPTSVRWRRRAADRSGQRRRVRGHCSRDPTRRGCAARTRSS